MSGQKVNQPLQRVLGRVVKKLYEPDAVLGTRMVSAHVLEKLECGHTRDAYPEVDPLIARYRKCGVCARDESMPEPRPLKKPVQSVRVAWWRKDVA